MVTFRNSFRLPALDAAQPPGTYRVVVDEEEIPGLSFIAYRRAATLLHIPAVGVRAKTASVVAVDPKQLARAIALDAEPQPDTVKG
jgi:hypothetical protein